MAAPEICRICLAFEVKLYEYDRYELKKFYEQFMASKIDEDECLPRYFCYECAAMLHKFHKFKEKCYNGEKVLRKLMYNGPITTKLISNLDRETIKLQSPLSLIMVNHRVRTYVVKSKPKPLITAVATENVLETSSIPDDNDYADVFDDKDDFPPLPEVVSVNETMVDKMVHLDVDNEQIHIKKEKTPPVESVIDTEKVITPDERLLTEDEIIFTNDVKETVDDAESMAKEAEAVVEKKKNQAKDNKKKREGAEVLEVNKKVKKFEIKKKKENKEKKELDSNNWSKFNLSEEQAVEEFKARAQHKRFISAKYKCNDCLKGFSKEDMLSRHVKKKHSESIGKIECRFCRTRFKLKCFLTRHIREHYTKYKCLRCDLVCPLLSTALFHEQYHNGVIRKCAHCSEEFKHLSTYYTHLRTHRSEHVCTICGASFVSAVGLNLHKKIKHIDTTSITEGAQGEDEYCKHCDIRFETKKAYEEHLIHSAKHVDGIKDLEVQVPLGTIRNPKKRRSNPKSISVDCYICGKNFLTQAARRKHHLAEHPRQSMIAPNERQICEICGVSLVPGSVSSHLNTHTKKKLYTCNTCGRQFNSKCGMTKHLLSHSSEKPVACTLCDKRFKEVSSMKLHYRTFHLKEPYPKRNRNKKSADISMLNDYVKNLMTT